MFAAWRRTHLRKARLQASILSALLFVTTGVSAIGAEDDVGDARKDEPPPKADDGAVVAGAGALMNDAKGFPPAGLGKLNPTVAWPGAGAGAVSLTLAKMPAPLAPAPMPSIAT